MRSKTRNSQQKDQPKFKSRWEGQVAKQLEDAGYPVEYEKSKIEYEIPASSHVYTPDFTVGSWFIEAKGKFDRQDRKKHLLIKEQYPKLKIVILFQNANQRIAKRSKTTYAMWCEKNGIRYLHQKLDLSLLDK